MCTENDRMSSCAVEIAFAIAHDDGRQEMMATVVRK